MVKNKNASFLKMSSYSNFASKELYTSDKGVILKFASLLQPTFLYKLYLKKVIFLRFALIEFKKNNNTHSGFISEEPIMLKHVVKPTFFY